MSFNEIKDLHCQRHEQTSQLQRDFQSRWLDANGERFADGVLGGLAENLIRLGEHAAAAAQQQRQSELSRSEIAHHITAAKLRDEAQDAKNKEIDAECSVLEQEIITLKGHLSQLSSSRIRIQQMLSEISSNMGSCNNGLWF